MGVDQISKMQKMVSSRMVGVLLATFVFTVAAPPLASHAEDVEKPNLIGLASRDFRSDIPTLKTESGRAPALFSLFWTLGPDWPNAWGAAMLEELEQLGTTPYIELTVGDTGTFRSLAAGNSDQLIEDLISSIGPWLESSPEHRILIAPFPEANLSEHPWGGRPEDYKSAYERVHAAFRAAGLGPEKVRFVFAMNGLSSPGFEYDQFYPGDTLSDLIGFSKLNRGTPWRDYDITFATHIVEMQQTISRTKPILITQTGSVRIGGDRSAWLADLFAGLKANSQVVGAIYFNRTKDYDYRVIASSGVDPAFLSGVKSWSPSQSALWIFDGSLDAWVAQRASKRVTPFADVGNSVFAADIAWLEALGITKGCNPPINSRFCPNAFVTRGEMAAFLNRALPLGKAGRSDLFADDDGTVFESDIDRLAVSGITRGCNPPINDRFCPHDPVTRGEMAAFLTRAFDYTAQLDDSFDDDDDLIFEGDIEKLAAAGVTRGCNPPLNNRFCPSDFVTRGQMAAFLKRALTS